MLAGEKEYLVTRTELQEELNKKLDTNGDSKDNITSFTSSDTTTSEDITEWTDVEVLSSKEKHSSIFSKVSQMFKNIRYLWKLMGTTDISSIGDGTATGALSSLNNNKLGKNDAATSANKLNTDAGSATQPVYFSNGVPVAGTYSLNKTVPSDAKFTDTTYSQGTGISISGTTINHSNSVTAGTAQGDANKTLSFGGTFTIPTVTYDAQGHVTGKGTTTMTMPSNPNTDTKNTAGSTDTSSKIFLVGATSQAANPQTYSHDTAYVGTDGCVYSGGKKTSVDGHTHSYAGSSSAGGDATRAIGVKDFSGSNTIQIGYAGDGATTSNLSHIAGYLSGGKQIKDVSKSVLQSWLGLGSGAYTSSYAGSSSAGGAATSANKLNTNAGSGTNPVYFANGIPKACSYSLNKTVPSNAVFTDTNTWRGIQNNLTSTSTSDSLSAYQGKLLNDKINSLQGNMGCVYLTSATTVSNKGAIITKSLSNGTYFIIIWLSNNSGGGAWFGNNGAIVVDATNSMYGAIQAGGCIMKVHTINSTQTVGLWNGNGKSITYGAGTCLFYMKTF